MKKKKKRMHRNLLHFFYLEEEEKEKMYLNQFPPFCRFLFPLYKFIDDIKWNNDNGNNSITKQSAKHRKKNAYEQHLCSCFFFFLFFVLFFGDVYNFSYKVNM